MIIDEFPSQVESSGFNIHIIPSITNGMDIIVIMDNILKNDSSEISGLLTNQGRGNVITNQIDASRIINFSLAFFVFNNRIFSQCY